MGGQGDSERGPLHNLGAATITTPGDRYIVVTRLFDAPRAVVFEAWTKAEHVARWWDPSGVPARRMRDRPEAQRSLSRVNRAVSFFMTDVYGAPRAFVLAMPFLMPNAWEKE